MTTITKNSPPLLENNVELQLLLKELTQKKEDLSMAQGQVDEKINQIQQSCVHPTFTEERSRENSRDGINMLVSKTCTECGLKMIKPKGESWVICENCWGPMKFDGAESGQGCNYQHYGCKKCGHHHYHT